MKKIAAVFLCLWLLAGAALADPVSFGGASFPRESVSLDLGDLEVTDWDAFLAFLGEFPALRQVDMFATVVTQRQITRLVKAFPEVRFGWTIRLCRDHVVRTDQTAFSTLHDGSCYDHHSGDMDPLRYCTELRALDLGHNKLKDLSFLEPLVHLRVLILACNPDLKNIRVLSSLQELEYLELFSTGVTSAAPLAALPRLMDLNLMRDRIGDWERLKEIRSLRRLWVSVGDAKADELREALPLAAVVNHGQPTGNGWRRLEDGTEDPHYAVIYRMFRENRYIPFAESAPWIEADESEEAEMTEETN